MIRIRSYRPSDREACFHVFRRAVHEGAVRYDQQMRDGWAPRATPDLATRDKLLDQECWVSEFNGQLTGYMSLMPDGHLDTAFVLPEAMGQGHAAALYERLLARAQALGLARLTVHANEYSSRFLGRRGWRVDRVEPMTLPNGAPFERFHMVLDLTDGAAA